MAIQRILREFEGLERQEQAEAVDEMYHMLPKELREKHLLGRWIAESR